MFAFSEWQCSDFSFQAASTARFIGCQRCNLGVRDSNPGGGFTFFHESKRYILGTLPGRIIRAVHPGKTLDMVSVWTWTGFSQRWPNGGQCLELAGKQCSSGCLVRRMSQLIRCRHYEPKGFEVRNLDWVAQFSPNCYSKANYTTLSTKRKVSNQILLI